MGFTSQRTKLTADFNVPSQCLAALHGINATDVEDAVNTLNQLLEGMAVASPDPLGHLQVLEEMRPTLDFALESIARRYSSHPLPPSGGEDETFRLVVRMWALMASNYGFVALRAANATDPAVTAALADRRGLILQRRLQYQSLSMIEYFRARRELPEGMWRDLHTLYLSAERAGVAGIRVSDSLNEVWGAQSPLEGYVAMLLVDAASPCSRTARELVWLVRWASRFAPYCSLEPGLSNKKHAYYALDTSADHGFRPVGLLSSDARSRSLNTTKLAAHIQAVVTQLKKGVAAKSLGLGDDCVQPACARLLVSLYRPWGLAAAGRKFQRREHRGKVQVCTDPAAIAYYLTGSEFIQPDEMSVRHLDFTRTEALLTLGEQVEGVEKTADATEMEALQLGYVKEPWDILDQSVAGFRLVRVAGESRVEHRQLVGISVPNGGKTLLAEISWLQYQSNGALHAGVSMMPGPPVLAPVKLMINGRSAKDYFRIGFLIPGVPTLKTDPTLIVPVGWFMPNRRVAIHADQTWYARMINLVSRGTNFDRVSFVREEQSALPESEP